MSELPPLTKRQILQYSRHILLPQIGISGQQKLRAASVLIIGTGGLGSPVSLYLAAAGIGKLGIVDFDVVDYSNLQRQILHGHHSIGKPKVDSARERLHDINPEVEIITYPEPFTSINAMEIMKDGYDILVDCSDNFPTRYLTNDLCVLLGKPNVYGAIFRFEGQASVFDGRDGACYRCIFPEPPPPASVPSCGESGVLGVLPGIIGAIQATEAIKLILNIGDTLKNRLLLYSALEMSFDIIRLHKNPQCPVCGEHPTITSLIDYEAFCGVPVSGYDRGSIGFEWDISPQELAQLIAEGKPITLLDVREPNEQEICTLPHSINIPLGELAARMSELQPAAQLIVYCKSGRRSALALEQLVRAGFSNVKNLKGGINAWAKDIDPHMPYY